MELEIVYEGDWLHVITLQCHSKHVHIGSLYSSTTFDFVKVHVIQLDRKHEAISLSDHLVTSVLDMQFF